MTPVSSEPPLSVGLPVRNGEPYLAQAIEAILGQSFEDLELLLSDNASDDATPDICRHYERQDPRVRYFRQPRNIGLAPNANFVVDRARGKLFKWAASDDLYARTLLERCVAALDEHPEAVLAHSWTALIDASGELTHALEYPLLTSSRQPAERFASVLFGSGGDDIYGVVRTEVLRRVAPLASHHHADRSLVAELALHGPFRQVPGWLYFRREHPAQAEQAHTTVRARCANMDPRRADRLRHPGARLAGEYVWAFVTALRRAPLASADRRACYQALGRWLARRGRSGYTGRGARPRAVTGAGVPLDDVPGAPRAARRAVLSVASPDASRP